jgi:Na+-transporting NADH:ubiquinone oxidoreductase subunit C
VQHSNGYIIRFIVILTVVLGSILSIAATFLKDRQDINKDLDAKKQILGAVTEINSETDVLALYKEQIEAIVVDINGDEQKTEVDPSKINIGKEYKKSPDKRLYPVFKYKEDGKVFAYIIPTYGNGLWDKIWGFVAVSNDFNSLAGISLDHKGETPGLGSRIAEPSVMARYKGKKIYDDKGKLVSINMLKGEHGGGDKSIKFFADKDNEVDGLSGATMTTKGVNKMLKNYFTHYENYFNSIKREREKQQEEILKEQQKTVELDSMMNQTDSLVVETEEK